MKTFELYMLTFPNGKQYVGITTRGTATRFSQHKSNSREGAEAVYAAWRKHGEPVVQTLAVLNSEEDLLTAEKKAVAVFNTLTPNGYNMTAGGEGMLSPCDEARARLSASLKAQWTNPEIRARRSAATKAYYADPEARARHRVAMKSALADPEIRARQSASMKARYADPEARARQSAATKAATADPEIRARRSAATKVQWANLEARLRQSAFMKARYADPEVRARHSARHKGLTHSRETRAKISNLRWVNNGEVNRRIPADAPLPEGFQFGRFNPRSYKGITPVL